MQCSVKSKCDPVSLAEQDPCAINLHFILDPGCLKGYEGWSVLARKRETFHVVDSHFPPIIREDYFLCIRYRSQPDPPTTTTTHTPS